MDDEYIVVRGFKIKVSDILEFRLWRAERERKHATTEMESKDAAAEFSANLGWGAR